MNYSKFIDQLKETFSNYLTPIKMGSVKDTDYDISKTSNRSETTNKKSFRVNSKIQRSFCANPAVSSSMVAGPSGDLINTTVGKDKNISKSPIREENEEQSSVFNTENIRIPYKLEKIDEESFHFEEYIKIYKEKYNSDDYCLLYNGLGPEINTMKKFTKTSKYEDRKFMTRFGASLATISFGIYFDAINFQNTNNRFNQLIKQRKFVDLLKIRGDQEKVIQIPRLPITDLKSSIQADQQVSNYQKSEGKTIWYFYNNNNTKIFV